MFFWIWNLKFITNIRRCLLYVICKLNLLAFNYSYSPCFIRITEQFLMFKLSTQTRCFFTLKHLVNIGYFDKSRPNPIWGKNKVKKRSTIFMQENANFLNAHLNNFFKSCVRSCRQLSHFYLLCLLIITDSGKNIWLV